MAAPSNRVVVLGSSFAGMTAALEMRKHLDDRHEIVVLDPREDFTFIPSLIWLPFGTREADGRHVPARAALRRARGSSSSTRRPPGWTSRRTPSPPRPAR